MALPMAQLEGTREEILAHFPDFGGRKLRVEVYSVEPDAEAASDVPEGAVQEDYQARLALALQDVVERSRTMKPKPGTHDYLQEGRAGGMFGYDPIE